jgi:Carbohydrate esterase, sialic acid-specific acetylesterase
MSIFHQANNVFPSGLSVTGGITTDSLTVNGVPITSSGGGGGGTITLDQTVPTLLQQQAAELSGSGLATFYSNDSTKAPSCKVTNSIMSEVDAINGEVVTLQTGATTLATQVAELDNVVGVLTGVTLGSGALSTGAAALSAITAATSTNAALKKSDLLDSTTVAGITSTSTTTTYDAKTISTIATAVTSTQSSLSTLTTNVNNLAIPSIVDNSSFSTTITLVGGNTIRLASIANIVVGTQIVVTGATTGTNLVQGGIYYVLTINTSLLQITVSNLPLVSQTLAGFGSANGLSIAITCYNLNTSTSATSVPSANALTTVQKYVTNELSQYSQNIYSVGTNSASAVTVGNANYALNLNGSTVNINGTAYSVGSSVSAATTSTAGTVTLASAIDNTTNANNIPTAGQIVSYVAANSASFTPGFDIIVINGQSNGVGAAADTKDAVLDAPVADLPIFMLTTTTGTANTVVSAIEHIDSVNVSGFGNVATSSTQNTSVFTFAKLYARNYLQPGRKVLIVNNCAAATGIAGQNTSGMSAAMAVSGMPSGVSTVNLNWTPNSVASGTPLSMTYTIYTTSGATSGATTTKTVQVGSGTSSDNIYNLYNLALKRINIALNASIDSGGIDNSDGLMNGTNKVVALLWQQGESDAYENALPLAQYQTSLVALIDGYRALCGTTTPFLIGGFTPSFISGSWIAGTAAAASQYTNYFKTFGTLTSPRTYTGYADSQSPSNANDPNSVHFSCQGYRTMGQRFFKAYQFALTNVPTPLSLNGSLSSVVVGLYNGTSYPITISGFTYTGTATTYNVFYGTTTPTTQVLAANITSTSSTSITFNITPSTSTVLLYYFKVQIYNSYNTTPYPSLTTTSTTTIPAALTPVINGLSVSSATIYGITVQATSISYYASTNDTVILGFQSGATTYNTTVGALLAGVAITPTQAGSGSTFTTTLQSVSATCTNSISGLTSAQATSTFTPTSSIITALTSSAINTTYFTVNWTLSSTTGLATQTLTIAQSSTPTTYILNTNVNTIYNTYTFGSGLLSPGTSFICCYSNL